MRGLARLIVLAAAAATASAFVPTTSSLGLRRHAVGVPLAAGHGRPRVEARRRTRCVVTAEAAHVTTARDKIQAALSPVELEVGRDVTRRHIIAACTPICAIHMMVSTATVTSHHRHPPPTTDHALLEGVERRDGSEREPHQH